MQAPETIQDPFKPIEVQDYARAISRVVNGGITFGEPIGYEIDKTGALVVEGANGRKDNIQGSWVVKTIVVGDFGTAVTFNHNLNVSVNGLGATKVNVVWPVENWHTSATPPPDLQLVFRHGDTVTANSIQLRPTSTAPPAGGATVAVFFTGVPPW